MESTELSKLEFVMQALDRVKHNMCRVCGLCGYNDAGEKINTTNCGVKRDIRIVRLYLEKLEQELKNE